jgi:hypothetical protein
MAQRRTKWVRVRALREEEKAAIAGRCERFIREELRPRFLPQIQPTAFNYPIDIFGKWRGNKYSFIERFRSGFADNLGWEFDQAFTRLDHCDDCLTEIRFDVMWHRHTGQWFLLHAALTLEEALERVRTDELLWPIS